MPEWGMTTRLNRIKDMASNQPWLVTSIRVEDMELLFNGIDAAKELLVEIKTKHPEIKEQGFTCPFLEKLNQAINALEEKIF